MTTEPIARICDACDEDKLVPFADLGDMPVLSGVHWEAHGDAVATPVGRVALAACPRCAYVRNIEFEPDRLVYDTAMDTSRHFSPAFQRFTSELVENLNERYDLQGKLVLDIGCGQGEFLKELTRVGGARGVGYDARYAGEEGEQGDTTFHSAHAPRGGGLPEYDFFTLRHWFEHLDDPFDFLVDLREQAGGREVFGYVEIPDAAYELGSAGWQVVYPQVSYFDAYSLANIVGRAGWTVESTGTLFSGMYRYVEVSANRPRAGGHVAHTGELPSLRARDKQLATVAGFADRHHGAREHWRSTIARLDAEGAKPVLWGAGSRGVQFLALADRELALAAVVDLNPRKWGRFLPVTGHRVDPPSALTALQPKAVIITNPAYHEEIAKALGELGVAAEILQA
ncbi:methyltransferase domain-containing protein [Dactylosporangium sp. CS-033363]|uniref:methyltransferase domain-containing protein n=1 Tax=Dactylosporangium sp. CS-033363 TaxID=3239935 RepID=UPI003D914AA3